MWIAEPANDGCGKLRAGNIVCDGIDEKANVRGGGALVVAYAAAQGKTLNVSDADFIQWKTNLLSLYDLHGTTYAYKMSAVIDWGAFINAIISFLVIALVLFVIMKVAAGVAAKRAELKAKSLEAYYQKHPEERPVPPEPGEPEPTELDLLKEIRDALVETKEAKK